MLQAPMFEGLALDAGPAAQDVGGPAKVGVGRRHILQALVIAGAVQPRLAADLGGTSRSFGVTPAPFLLT